MGVKQTRPLRRFTPSCGLPAQFRAIFSPPQIPSSLPQNASSELEAGFQPTRAPLHSSHASPPLGAFLTEPQLSSRTHTVRTTPAFSASCRCTLSECVLEHAYGRDPERPSAVLHLQTFAQGENAKHTSHNLRDYYQTTISMGEACKPPAASMPPIKNPTSSLSGIGSTVYG